MPAEHIRYCERPTAPACILFSCLPPCPYCPTGGGVSCLRHQLYKIMPRLITPRICVGSAASTDSQSCQTHHSLIFQIIRAAGVTAPKRPPNTAKCRLKARQRSAICCPRQSDVDVIHLLPPAPVGRRAPLPFHAARSPSSVNSYSFARIISSIASLPF
jgi:hypothetical protein